MRWKIVERGDWSDTRKWLAKNSNLNVRSRLESYGARGVEILRSATPHDTGQTAAAWGYTVTERGRGRFELAWTNSNMAGTVSVAVLLQTGHGTGTGGYVTGIDYINPAMRPVFQAFADEIAREVR